MSDPELVNQVLIKTARAIAGADIRFHLMKCLGLAWGDSRLPRPSEVVICDDPYRPIDTESKIYIKEWYDRIWRQSQVGPQGALVSDDQVLAKTARAISQTKKGVVQC